jgi:hypothetical protein
VIPPSLVKILILQASCPGLSRSRTTRTNGSGVRSAPACHQP